MQHHVARVGDIVRKADKPDGPEMRVFAYDSGGNLHCEWKGDDGRCEETFDPSVLVMVAERGKSPDPEDKPDEK